MADLLNTQEAAQKLRLAPQTLVRWRREGAGPAFIRLGRKVMYRESQIANWLDVRQETPGEPVALVDMKLPEFPSFQGDPVAIQQAMRDEWER